LGWELY